MRGSDQRSGSLFSYVDLEARVRADHPLRSIRMIVNEALAVAWDQTTFGKNRDRLLAGDVAHKILAAVLAHPKVKRLLSTEHFSVDGTMIEAWASMKSVRPKDGSGEPPAPGRNGETDRHAGYRTSQVIRKRIEEVFGWAKAAAGLRKTRHRGLGHVGWQFTFTLAAYNLIRLPKLLKAAA